MTRQIAVPLADILNSAKYSMRTSYDLWRDLYSTYEYIDTAVDRARFVEPDGWDIVYELIFGLGTDCYIDYLLVNLTGDQLDVKSDGYRSVAEECITYRDTLRYVIADLRSTYENTSHSPSSEIIPPIA